MSVLVVDDNSDSRQLVADILRSMDIDSLLASDGYEALREAQKQPELILLDVNMPGMSGFEVCERLKSDPITSHIPVLMLTALGDVDNRVQGFRYGADDYLTKPYSPRELMERIRVRLRTKNEADQLRKTQELLRQTFERYVSPTVVEALLRNPDAVKLGGKLQTVTVLFADLEGFTSLSEQMEPEALLKLLNTYHTMLVDVIRTHGGTVDKFIGDGVMALYNTPLTQPNHALFAMKTALAIRDALPRFHEQFAPGQRMTINFGVHTGDAVVGNVGAPEIMNYTAVGDTVNLAARLQAISRGGQILMSEATYQAMGKVGNVTSVGELSLRGRRESVFTYEMQSLPPDVDGDETLSRKP